jgi:hypothetical protein
MRLNYDRLVIDTDPNYCLFLSEPYVVYTKAGFTAAADVLVKKLKLSPERTVLLGAASLSLPLFERIQENGMKLTGIEVWIYKEGEEKSARYRVED